jgi:acyl-CoA thioesterase-2
MLASFHNNEPGLDHQAKMPDVPAPEDLPNEMEVRAKLLPTMPEPVRRYYERERPIELRPVEFERYGGKKVQDGRFHVWIRTTGRLPDDLAIHQCVLAYASDLTLLDAALARHGRTLFEKEFMAASLDHAMWLHRPFRADDWLLYAQDSPNLHGSRAFSRGLIFTRDGTLVASVAQEGLVRERRG